MGFSRILLCGVGFAAFAMASNAIAQSAPVDDTAVLEEVVVTARRQAENLQDVPIAVTAYSGEALERRQVTTREALADFTPSLMTITGGYPKEFSYFALRGQGPAFGSVPGVVPYFAEVPNPVTIDGRPGTYLDLANVQVLAGPQGTLFGKNATGGNILFEPQRPTDRFEGEITGEVGNYNARRAQAVVNLPIVADKVLLRVAGEWARRDGATVDVGPFFAGRDYDNLDYHTARASLTVRPTENFELYTVARYYRSDNNGPATVLTDLNPLAVAAYGAFFPGLNNALTQQQARGPRRVSYDLAEFSETEYWQILNHATLELGDNLRLKNVVSYSSFTDWYGYDYDATPFPLGGQSSRTIPVIAPRYFTEELQLQGKALDGAISFSTGLYYDKQSWDGPAGIEQATQLPIYLLFGAIPAYFVQENESKAVFGQATWNVGRSVPSLEGLSLTGGLRYTWEESLQTITIIAPPAAGGTVSSEYPSYTFSADYEVSDAAHVYVAARSAYKSGGINAGAPAAYATFPPEKLQDVEVGLKSQFNIGGAAVRANLAAYQGEYKNIQRTTQELLGGVTLNVNRSAAKARIKGLEFTGQLVPFRGLTLTAAYSYIDARYTSVTDASAGAILVGAPFPYTPEHKYSIGADWEVPLGDTLGNLRFTAAYSHQSEFSTAQTNAARVRYLPGYGTLNLSASWENMGGRPVDLTVFASNVTDELYATGLQDTYANINQGTVTYTYSEPRLYGVRLRYRFGE